MAAEIVQHGHCHVCGRVVKHGSQTCSENCKAELDKTRKSRQRMMIFTYASVVVLIILFFVLPLLGR